jgi:hypothetical protein
MQDSSLKDKYLRCLQSLETPYFVNVKKKKEKKMKKNIDRLENS